MLISTEKEFQTALHHFAKKQWRRFYKIPDEWFSLKPFDCIIAIPNKTIYCELKIANTSKTNPLKLLREHQFANLQHLTKLWHLTIVLVYLKKDKQYKFTLYNFQTNQISHHQRLSEVFSDLLWEDLKH